MLFSLCIVTNWKCTINCQVSTFAVRRSIAYQFLQDAYCSIVCSCTAAVSLAQAELCVLYGKGARLFL